MKKRFSLNRFLNNDKMVLIFSLLMGIAIWGGVVFNSTNEITTIHGVSIKPVRNDFLNDSGLVAYDGNEKTVSVRVTGRRIQINRLTEKDIVVEGDYANITEAGVYSIPLAAISTGDYKVEILDSIVAKVTVDHFTEKAFDIVVDIGGIKLAEDVEDQSLALDNAVVSGLKENQNQITIFGPLKILSKIDHLVLSPKGVTGQFEISKTTGFETEIEAVDLEDEQVDISEHFEIRTTLPTITVPVSSFKKIELTVKKDNLPVSLASKEGFILIEPSSISLIGSAELVSSNAELFNSFYTLNFNNISLDSTEFTVKLPTLAGGENIRIQENIEEVKVKIDMSDMASKKINLPLNETNTTIKGENAANYTLMQNILTDIVLVGSKESIEQIDISNLQVSIDISDTTATGGGKNISRTAEVVISGYSDVWVYYGSERQKGYPVTLELIG